MSRVVDQCKARERLLGWLRTRAREWLSISDHSIARLAGLRTADDGMELLRLLQVEGLVEIERGPVQRHFRFLSPDTPAPIGPPPAPEPIAPSITTIARPAAPTIPPKPSKPKEAPVRRTKKEPRRPVSFDLSRREAAMLRELAGDRPIGTFVRDIVIGHLQGLAS